jgi:hypothetical protein
MDLKYNQRGYQYLAIPKYSLLQGLKQCTANFYNSIQILSHINEKYCKTKLVTSKACHSETNPSLLFPGYLSWLSQILINSYGIPYILVKLMFGLHMDYAIANLKGLKSLGLQLRKLIVITFCFLFVQIHNF